MRKQYLGGTSVDPLFSARVPKVLIGTYISAPHNPTSSHRGCHSTQLRGGRASIPCDRVYATLPPRIMVGVLRFELRVSWSQTRRDGQTSLYPDVVGGTGRIRTYSVSYVRGLQPRAHPPSEQPSQTLGICSVRPRHKGGPSAPLPSA